MVSDEHRPGFYKDKQGNWQKDRRKSPDRRQGGGSVFTHHDRRTSRRRKTGHDILERETKMQIKEALEDLVAEHESPSSEHEE